MLKIIRYATAICLAIISIIYFKNKENKKRLLKFILGLILSILILIMPFENLFLKFATPEKAFNYAANNAKIIKIIEQEKSTLIIYSESEHTKATIINNCDGKWKAPFLPEDQILSNLENGGLILITKERNSKNFYVMIAVKSETKTVGDNCNSLFEVVSQDDFYTDYVAYVENYESSYIINIDGDQYKIKIED